MTYQKGGETFFTRKMKKAKEGQIINLNEVKIFNLGSGNDKKNFQKIFKGSLNYDYLGNCSVTLRFKKKNKTGDFECAMPKKYKEYFEGGLFSKYRNCYKLQFLGANITYKKKNISNFKMKN